MPISSLLRRALLTATELRRKQRGPLREAWSLQDETRSRVLHHYSKRSVHLPLAVQRWAIESILEPPRSSDELEVEATTLGGVPCTWLRPKDADPDRLLVYLHGGGYSIGSIRSHAPFVSKVARRGKINALMVDYRLAPEHPFPAGLDDARSVWNALLDGGVDASRTVVAGESAGGGLSLALLLALRDAGEPLPAAAALLSPWLDLTMSGASIHTNARYDYLSHPVLEVYAARYAPGACNDPLVSPLFANHEKLPPLLLQAGEAEAILDDAVRLHAKASAARVESTLHVYADMIHAFMLIGGTDAARAAVDELCAFIDEHTK